MTYRPTYYEIALSGPDGERFRLPFWARAKTQKALRTAATLADHWQRIRHFTGSEDLYWDVKAQAYASVSGWRIRYTGRTEREAHADPLPTLPRG